MAANRLVRLKLIYQDISIFRSIWEKQKNTHHFSCGDLPLAEQAPAVDTAGVHWHGLPGVPGELPVSHGHGQVQAGGAPVVTFHQVSLGSQLRRQLEAVGLVGSHTHGRISNTAM